MSTEERFRADDDDDACTCSSLDYAKAIDCPIHGRRSTEERFRTPGAEWTTYRRADGEMIVGDYAFVTELEWFEEDEEPTDLIEETWVLRSTRKLTVNERPPDEDDDQ